MELNNKKGAGDRQKSPWKRPGLSMEFKSKTLTASFTKSNDEELDYDFGSPVENAAESHAAVLQAERKEDSLENVSGLEDKKSMDCLKNTLKAGAKVPEISSKTNWMKDKVSNFWGRKGKQDDVDRSDIRRTDEELNLEDDSVGMYREGEAKLCSSKPNAEEVSTCFSNTTEMEIVDSPSIEIKDGNKDKKQGRASTGWIRDQVSSLISKGKNYASSGSVASESGGSVDDTGGKAIDRQSPRSKTGSLSQSISEHYTLKQKVEGDENHEEESYSQGAVTIGFEASDSNDCDKSEGEKEKFVDIHESINESIARQMFVAFKKDECQNVQGLDDRPLSPQTTSLQASGGTKKSSAKSKLKGFLTSRPITTDLTHIPISPSTKEEKHGNNSSTQTQTKRKFKFGGKLSFSELLHSQEHGTQMLAEGDMRNADSLSASPVLTRFESPVSDDDDEDNITLPLTDKSSPSHSANRQQSDLSFFMLWTLAVALYALYVIPINTFIKGFAFGSLVMYIAGCLVIWLFCPSGKSFEQYKQELKKYPREQDISSSEKKPMRAVDPDNLRKPRDIKGWVHFLLDYDPRVFSLDMTKDVYAVLKGETLYILFCKPQAENKPVTPQKLKKVRRGLRTRRTKKQELVENQQPAFVFEKEHKISLSKCQLSLQPLDLPMRRIWNRKYPIRIDIPPGAMHVRDIDVPFEELTSNFEDYFDFCDDDWTMTTTEETFHVFPITAREKEDWFYRMQLCNKPLKHQTALSDARKGNLSSRPAESYPHYMVECIRESEKITARVVNGKRLEPHSAWLNVLLGRAFWDVWHEPYWKRKVWVKIQSRLSKLNTPPIIKEIYVKDLHLGHTLPVIHKGSLPELDEYGVWTDLQVTYQGEFTLTLETQLNVDYYVALLTKIVKQQTQAQESAQMDVKMKVMREKNSGEAAENAAEGDATDFDGVMGLQEQLPEMILEAIDNVEVDEEDLGAALADDPMISDPRTKAFLESKTGKRLSGIVGWLARSKIAKRVAETDFAKKAYEKAYEKFRKMPIILKVTVQSLKGTLAVNISPPPTNRLWFGFRGTPAVLLTAHPKLGDRHVRLTYLTDWIERKLKDEFKKLFVLPSMQDISVKLMYSRLEELYPERPLS